MQRLAILFILTLVLVGLILLDRAAAGWRYAVVGDPGVLLYAATFDGGALDGFNTEWEQYGGALAAAVRDGAFQFEIDQPFGAPLSAPHVDYLDFDARAQGRATAGDNANNSYGLVFRMRDPNNHYRFFISSEGYYSVVRTIDGAQHDLSAWIPSSAINPGIGALNRIRVVGRGAEFAFFINDQPVQVCVPDEPSGESTYSGGVCYGTMRDSLIDTTFPSGRVGFAAEALDLPGAVGIAFDHLLIYSPDDA